MNQEASLSSRLYDQMAPDSEPEQPEEPAPEDEQSHPETTPEDEPEEVGYIGVR